jgi:hypothetical protein
LDAEINQLFYPDTPLPDYNITQSVIWDRPPYPDFPIYLNAKILYIIWMRLGAIERCRLQGEETWKPLFYALPAFNHAPLTCSLTDNL